MIGATKRFMVRVVLEELSYNERCIQIEPVEGIILIPNLGMSILIQLGCAHKCGYFGMEMTV